MTSVGDDQPTADDRGPLDDSGRLLGHEDLPPRISLVEITRYHAAIRGACGGDHDQPQSEDIDHRVSPHAEPITYEDQIAAGVKALPEDRRVGIPGDAHR